MTHILNVAYGVENAFLNDFIYKNISILDLPETDILSYFPECFEFIEEVKVKVSLVSIHSSSRTEILKHWSIIHFFLSVMNKKELLWNFRFSNTSSVPVTVQPSSCASSHAALALTFISLRWLAVTALTAWGRDCGIGLILRPVGLPVAGHSGSRVDGLCSCVQTPERTCSVFWGTQTL